MAGRAPSPLVGQAPPPPAPQRRPFPGWAIALFIILAVSTVCLAAVFVLPFVILGSVFSTVNTALPIADNLLEVRSGVRTIQTGIETWRADDAAGKCPPRAVVSRARLGAYVDPWPLNPYTGAPMRPGAGPGDYLYVRLPGGDGYTLTGYGEDGVVALTVP